MCYSKGIQLLALALQLLCLPSPVFEPLWPWMLYFLPSDFVIVQGCQVTCSYEQGRRRANDFTSSSTTVGAHAIWNG